MKIISRTEFLKLPDNVLYCKCDTQNMGGIEIKASKTGEWGNNDWVSDDFFMWAEEPYRNQSGDEYHIGDTFRWAQNQTSRDGLYETEEEVMFAIFDNKDIEQLILKLKNCLK